MLQEKKKTVIFVTVHRKRSAVVGNVDELQSNMLHSNTLKYHTVLLNDVGSGRIAELNAK